MRRKNLLGQTFGYWKVLEISKPSPVGSYYWKCECKCGTIKDVLGWCLEAGTSKSCGCSRNWKRKLSIEEQNNYYLYDRHLSKCKVRNIVSELTRDEYSKMIKQPCYYCGMMGSNIFSSPENKSRTLYNGIDRVDNTRGYTLDNCVPCCVTCNFAKRTMTEQEFRDWIYRIVVGDWYNGG